ncbi:hypothetical protein H4R99_000884, partial [Coemansia sp. RSA 1722]
MSSPKQYSDENGGGADRDRSQSALETYRQWLNESSSSSSNSNTSDVDANVDDSTTTANDQYQDSLSSKPSDSNLAPPLPNRTPPAPRHTPPTTTEKHLRPNSSTAPKSRFPLSRSNSPIVGSTSKSPRLFSRPRRLMQQMSLRSMLPSTPSPSPSADRLHPKVPRNPTRSRRKSSDRGMDTLYGNAWIAQPSMVPTAGNVENTPVQKFYDVPLNEKTDKHKTSIYSTSSTLSANSTKEKKKKNRKSHMWEYHTRDSKTGWAIVFWASLACFISLSTLFSYPVYESYYQTTTRNSLVSSGDPLILDDPDKPQDDYASSRF